MAPASIFDRARTIIRCHPGSSIVVGDAWEIDPGHHECEIMCAKCGRRTNMDISRTEYRQMDNSKPWEFEQERKR